MKAQMSAVPEGEGAVAKPTPPSGAAAALAHAAAIAAPRQRVRVIPGGQGTVTQGAAEKRKASALRKSDNFKVKLTDLQIEIDGFKNQRELDASIFEDHAEQYQEEIKDLRKKGLNLVGQSESLQGEITRLRNKVELLRAESDVVLQAKKRVAHDLAATGILLTAAKQKAEEAGLENQPKIDQLTAKRNKLVERLYHHQLLHPGVFPAEGSKTDA